MRNRAPYTLLVLALSFMSCSIEKKQSYNERIVGEWLCDSIVTDYLTYVPENNPTLFYYNKERVVITYGADGTLLVTNKGQFDSSYSIKDNVLLIKQEQFPDTLIKDILYISSDQMALEEEAQIVNNVINRGAASLGNRIRLYYTRKS